MLESYSIVVFLLSAIVIIGVGIVGKGTGTAFDTALIISMTPVAYKSVAMHKAITNASTTLFFYSALLIMVTRRSAPGIAEFYMRPRIELVFFSESV